MSARRGSYTALDLTEPGSPAARAHGCTCPAQAPERLPGGGLRFERDEACPLHRLPFAADNAGKFELARTIETVRDRERATTTEDRSRFRDRPLGREPSRDRSPSPKDAGR